MSSERPRGCAAPTPCVVTWVNRGNQSGAQPRGEGLIAPIAPINRGNPRFNRGRFFGLKSLTCNWGNRVNQSSPRARGLDSRPFSAPEPLIFVTQVTCCNIPKGNHPMKHTAKRLLNDYRQWLEEPGAVAVVENTAGGFEVVIRVDGTYAHESDAKSSARNVRRKLRSALEDAGTS